MSAITEQSSETSKTNEMSETDKEWLATDWERSDQEKKTEEIVTMEETSIDSETDKTRVPKKALVENDRRKSLAKNSRAFVESNNTVEEKSVRKYFTKKEQVEELAREKKAREKVMASTSVANDKARLYDTLASSELYGVTCQVKRREKPAVEKLTKQSGTAEIRVDDRKAAEFEEGIEMVPKNVQVFAHKNRKPAAVSEKNIQMNLRKFEKYKRHDKMSRIGRAAGLEKERKKKERKQEKWIDKYKHRNQRESDGSLPRRKQKSCNKATLIKEKLYNRKREHIYSRDALTHRHPSTQHAEACASRAEWHPDDVRRQTRVAPALRSVAELNKNRQTQCNLRDQEETQSRRDDMKYELKSTNKPKVWSCQVQSQFKAPEQIVYFQDYWDQEKVSRSCNESLEKKPQQIKRRYNVNVRETRLEVPMLKQYLPAYQTPGLIEELKEHDRMRLIQEREARRWTALSALRSTRDSSSSTKSRDQACGTSVMCDAQEAVSRVTSVSTRLTEGNTLPYQETQTFKDVVREFREKVIAAERPLISLSRSADKCKDLKQLFPPKNEDRGGFTMTPKFEKVVNRFKPICDKHKREEQCTTIYEATQRFQSESFSEMSSICSYSCEHRQFDVSTSADETDNNVDIS
ncbi:uncharacterized protein [Temnothorax nylanderi]|uniref:uncharacterized protein n=1 Tax=Temnothorax nylanderi TaxID=102681 RepID=UPI003A8B3119